MTANSQQPTANSQQPTANSQQPALSVSAPAPQGTISGKRPKILIFDDIAEDPFGDGQDLRAFTAFFNKAGYEAIGVRVVDHPDFVGEHCKARIPKEGAPYCAYTPEDAQYIINTEKPDMVLTAGQWPNGKIFSSMTTMVGIGGGAALTDLVREYDPAIPCVLHTGIRKHDGVVAEKMGGRDYMVAAKGEGRQVEARLQTIKDYFDTKLAQGRGVA
jgi:hypothetical protein